MTFCDAHNHLQDPRLATQSAEIFATLTECGITRSVVNGTCEKDWPAVAALATARLDILPAFGLHPWFVAERSEHWAENLEQHLSANTTASIGEIGLDRWIKGCDFAAQRAVL